MPLDLSILDFTYTMLGPAAALADAGHRVRVFVPDNPRFVRESRLPVYHQMLLARLGGGEPRPRLDADIVIYVESFADAAWALESGCQTDAPLPQDPLASSIHPQQLERRLELLTPFLARVPELVVVDMSDLSEPLHARFLSLPGRKLKRECTPDLASRGIEPFPFLYNPLLVALESTGGHAQYRVSGATVRDGWFCGTIHHWRYGGARLRCLEALVARHPRAQFDIHENGVPALANLHHTQLSRSVLHPPGRGEICFRTHEALCLGVPPLIAEPFKVTMPEGHQRIFATSLSDLPTCHEVTAFYNDAFRPAVAATVLLGASRTRDSLAPSAGDAGNRAMGIATQR